MALNKHVTGHFRLFLASGGINLFVGNNPEYCETIRARPGWGWEELVNLPRAEGVSGDMWDGQRYFFERVENYVRHEPKEFIKGLGCKALEMLSSRELPRNIDIYVFRRWSWVLAGMVWTIGGFGFPFGVLLPLGLLGMVAGRRRVAWAELVLFVATYSTAVIAVFASARYRVAIIPVMCILAAAGVEAIHAILRRKQWGRSVLVGGCVAAVMVVASLPGPFCQEQGNYEAELYANAAATCGNLGRDDEAMAYLQKALDLEPNLPSALANMGKVLTDKGEYEKAIVYYRRALEVKRDSPVVLNNLGSALAMAGRHQEAQRMFEEVLASNPRDPTAHYNIGNIWLARGSLGDAETQFRKAVTVEPDYALAHEGLALTLAASGRIREAAGHFHEVVRLDPANARAQFNLGRALAQSGRREEAITALRKARELGGDSAGCLERLARLLISRERPDDREVSEAVGFARRACELTNYRDPHALATLGQAYAAGGRLEQAIEVTQRALAAARRSRSPQLVEMLTNRLRSYQMQLDG